METNPLSFCRNPDVLDFDGLFERIAKLDFCVKGNSEGDTGESGRERRALPPVSDEKEEEVRVELHNTNLKIAKKEVTVFLNYP